MPDMAKDTTGCVHSWRSVAMPAVERAENVHPAWCSLCGSLRSYGIHEPVERAARRNEENIAAAKAEGY